MKRRSSLGTNPTAVDRLIGNTAYDTIKVVADDIDHVNTVASALDNGLFDNVDLVIEEPLKSNINTVANIHNEVTIVSNISTEVESIYNDKIKLDSIYNDKAKLDSIYNDKTKLDSIYNDKSKLDSLYNDKVVLDSLFADKSKLDSLYNDKVVLDSLYNDKESLDSIYENLAEILLADDNAIIATEQANISINKADEASISANNASISEANALSYKNSAEIARDQTLEALDNFDDRYLGQKTEDPITDNDGDPLVPGALYYNTTDDVMKVYEGSVWVAAYASLSGALLVDNNLGDVSDVDASKENLGLDKVDNTRDIDKPISTAMQNSLNTKSDKIQTYSTTTKYTDKFNNINYKLYIDNGEIVMEEI